jgi:ferredoxin
MNLIQLALLAEQFAQERPAIVVDSQRCVRAWHKDATCDRCVQVCPTGAITLEGGLSADPDVCVRCGACLNVCPTGAFEGYDGVHRLLTCVSQLVDKQRIEVACSQHPAPESGARGVDAVVTTSGCLAALGPSAYAGLIALGVEQVSARLDACAACPLAAHEALIRQEIAGAQALPGVGLRVDAAPVVDKPVKRPVYDVKNPPVSRRGLLSLVTGQVTRADDLLPRDAPQVEDGRSAPRERRRLLNTLRHLPQPDPLAPVPLPGIAFLKPSGDCTACEVCARVCPTGALMIEKDTDRFRLRFRVGQCTGCNLCVDLCDANALAWDDSAASVSEILDPEPINLHVNSLHKCKKCGARFAGEPDNGFCPVCAFRRKNPFAAVLPEALRARPQIHK